MGYFFGWLSFDPPILYHQITPEITDYLPEFPIARLIMYTWHLDIQAIREYHRRECERRPFDMLHHCVNDQSTYRQLTALGIPASFISHNAFIDEKIFDIDPNITKKYEAVYNARMSPFKRHQLADRVPRLLMLAGMVSGDDDIAYSQQVRAAMPTATIVDTTASQWKSPYEVAQFLNQSKVGLCLSACEGAMWGSVEYLLCGLPIVSTASLGGRDEWFDPRYTRVVRDDPQAVAQAVEDLVKLDFSPESIRASTLDRMSQHRLRLIELGQSIYSAQQIGRDFARDFYCRFTNKLGTWNHPDQIVPLYNSQPITSVVSS
jgi:glycosyltransferase involved in cell wall biosynthesis